MNGSMEKSWREVCSNRWGFGVEYSRVWTAGRSREEGVCRHVIVSFNCTFDLPVPSGPPLKTQPLSI